MDSPPGSDPWLPERFSLAEEQGKPQDCKAGASKKGEHARKTPTVRGTDCPRVSVLSSPSFALAGAKRTHVPRPRALRCSCSWLIGSKVLEGQEQTGFKAKGLAGRWRLGPSPLSPLPTGTYKTLVTFER